MYVLMKFSDGSDIKLVSLSLPNLLSIISAIIEPTLYHNLLPEDSSPRNDQSFSVKDPLFINEKVIVNLKISITKFFH